MTAAEQLERRYRRWLGWYPAAFRREYEAEILDVLLAAADEGQRRPSTIECVDLMANGLRLRLRPGLQRPAKARLRLVALMYLGALLELLAALVIVATADGLREALVHRYPGFTDADWQTVLAAQLAPLVVGALAAAVCWMGLGWAVGRGYRWAKLACALLFGVNGVSLIGGVAGGSATVAQADLLVGVGLCLVQLAAAVLLFQREIAWFAGRLALTAGLNRARNR